MERSLLSLPIRKWQEYRQLVNSGKACCTEIRCLELGNGKSRGEDNLLLGAAIFKEQSHHPTQPFLLEHLS